VNKEITEKTRGNFFSIFIFSILSLIIVSISSYIAILNELKWVGIIGGVTLMLFSIPFHLFGKNKVIFYKLSFLMNSVAIGLSISAYYTVRNIPFDIIQVVLSLICGFALLTILYNIFKKDIFMESNVFKFSIIAIIIALVLLALFWLQQEKTTFYSISFFLLLNTLFYVILFKTSIFEEGNINKGISIYSYGIYFIVTIIVLAILTEGNFDLDFGFWDNNKKKR